MAAGHEHAAPLVCVVMPIFNEQEVIPELLRRLGAVFDGMPELRFEALFVDDGSRDRSAALLDEAAARDSRLRLLCLSRNFGHQPALSAGMAHAGHADAVITMDADLQDPPELIPEMIAAWRAGAEVVLAVRRSRQDGGLRRLGFDAFHRFFGKLSDFPVESNTGTFGLLARPAVAAFNSLEERHRFFPGLRSWLGYRRAEVFYDRDERAAGTPGQTLRRLVRYALDGLFSFSTLPLRLLTYAGVLTACFGGGVGAYFVIKRLLGYEIAFTGFTTLVTLVLFLGGVQLVAIGVLGEYLGRIYDEVKRRPLYLVKPPPTRSRNGTVAE
jgi:glycosyltransferase involved in cell wall biosynthesis